MDASSEGLSAVLAQQVPRGEWPILFLGCKLINPEQHYAVVEKEVLTIRLDIEEFQYYFWCQQFMVISDHAPLEGL